MNQTAAGTAWTQREASWASTFLAGRGFTRSAPRSKRPSSMFVLEHVAIMYGFERNEFVEDRRADCARARHLAMFLAREQTLESLPQIAKAFGKKDHTTVMYACNRVRDRAAIDPDFADELARVNSTITESYAAYREAIESDRQTRNAK